MRLGNYEVRDELGRGGLGVVYRAVGPAGNEVAIKLLHQAGKEGALERFDRERRLLQELGKTGEFVPLVDAGMSPSGPYIVMPLLEGGSLRRRLEEGPLALDEAVALARDLARGLARAHERGVIHRDLKPENVLFTAGGRPVIADLGLAKHFRQDVSGASQSVALSSDGSVRGTAGYMPPEQVTGAEAAPAFDVFALGAVLYECVTGEPAFSADTVDGLVYQVAQARVVHPRKLRPECPRWLAGVVLRCLSRSPARRFADGAAVVLALEEGAAPTPAVSRPWMLALAIFAAGVVASGGIAWARAEAERRREELARTPAAPPPPKDEPPAAFRQDPYTARLVEGFAENKLATLYGVLGDYRWKLRNGVKGLALVDQRRVLAGTQDGGLEVVDLDTGEGLRVPLSARYDVRSVAVTPDGRAAAAGCDDGRVRLFDLSSTPPKAAGSQRMSGWVQAVALTQDLCLAVSDKGDAFAYPLTWGEEGPSLGAGKRLGDRSKAGYLAAALAPGKGLAVTGRDSGSLQLWSLDDFSLRWTVKAHEGQVNDVAFTHDGLKLVSCDATGHTRVADAVTGEELASLSGHSEAYALSISPNDQLAAVGYAEGELVLWDLASGARDRSLRGHWNDVQALAFLAEGRRLVSAGGDVNVREWDLEAGRAVAPGADAWGHGDWVEGLAFTPDGRALVSSSHDETIKVWSLTDAARGRPRASRTLRGHQGKVNCLDLSVDGRRAVTAGDDGTVRWWDLAKTGQAAELGRIAAHEGIATQAVWWGEQVVSAGRDGKVRRWDLETGEAILDLDHGARVNGVGVSASSRRIVSGGHDKALKVWSEEGKLLHTCKHSAWVSCLTVSPDGRRVLAGDWAGGVRLWDVETGKLLLQTDGHSWGSSKVYEVAFTPDGRTGFSVALDQRIRVWDLSPADVEVPKGAQAFARKPGTFTLASSSDLPLSLAFSADGQDLAVGTGRGIVLWFRLKPLR